MASPTPVRPPVAARGAASCQATLSANASPPPDGPGKRPRATGPRQPEYGTRPVRRPDARRRPRRACPTTPVSPGSTASEILTAPGSTSGHEQQIARRNAACGAFWRGGPARGRRQSPVAVATRTRPAVDSHQARTASAPRAPPRAKGRGGRESRRGGGAVSGAMDLPLGNQSAGGRRPPAAPGVFPWCLLRRRTPPISLRRRTGVDDPRCGQRGGPLRADGSREPREPLTDTYPLQRI